MCLLVPDDVGAVELGRVENERGCRPVGTGQSESDVPRPEVVRRFAFVVHGVAADLVADRFDPSRRGEALGTFSSFSMVGRFSAPFLGGALIYYTNFTSLYLIIGVSATLALVFSF